MSSKALLFYAEKQYTLFKIDAKQRYWNYEVLIWLFQYKYSYLPFFKASYILHIYVFYVLYTSTVGKQG